MRFRWIRYGAFEVVGIVDVMSCGEKVVERGMIDKSVEGWVSATIHTVTAVV